MTQLTNSERPTSLNTVEKQLAYDALLAAHLYHGHKVIEQSGNLQRAVEAVILPADDKTIRLIVRVSLELPTDYANSTEPLYNLVKEIDNVSIPVGWTVP
jgi:hypothetical protein